MADQRRVGHAIRRRMGANPSHLGQAQKGRGNPMAIWHPPGPQPGMVGTPTRLATSEESYTGGRLKGVPDVYETGTDTVGRGAGPPLGDSSKFVSGVSDAVSEPHPPRRRVESSGARLTVSPSMKMPQESPVPLQGGGYPVPSSPGRTGMFGAGQQEMYSG